MAEIWTLVSTTPENFRGGGIWSTILSINGALRAIAYALLALFFVVGMMKTCSSFSLRKRYMKRNSLADDIPTCISSMKSRSASRSFRTS